MYADRDGDGYPDHVQGPDGLWHPFNPQTGELLNAPQVPYGGQSPLPAPAASPPAPRSLPSAAPTGGNYSTAPAPTGIGGGARQGFAPPPSSPSGGQKQIFVPGGASAGPYKTAAAADIYSGDRAFNSSGNPYSGGRGTHPLYDKFAAKGNAMEAKVRGMASSIGSGSGSTSGSYPSYSSSYPSYPKPETYDPYKPEKVQMRGWSRSRVDASQAPGLLYDPSPLIPLVSNLNADSPFGDTVRALPMSTLTMLSGGNKVKAPTTDAYGNLTASDRSLSSFTNQAAKTYDGILNRDKWFDYDQMAGNLMRANPNSALGQQFNAAPAATRPQTGYLSTDTGWKGHQQEAGKPAPPPITSQMSSLSTNLSALLGATVDPRVASSQTDYAGTLIDRFGSRFLRKPASKTPNNLARTVGRRVLYA